MTLNKNFIHAVLFEVEFYVVLCETNKDVVGEYANKCNVTVWSLNPGLSFHTGVTKYINNN